MSGLDVALVVQNAVRNDGQGRAMLELARCIVDRGHAVTLYAHTADPSLQPWLRFVEIPRRPGPQIVDDLSMLRTVTARLSRADHDVACVLGPTALPECPTVFYAHFSHRGWRATWDQASRPGVRYRAYARVLERLERRCARHAEVVLAPTECLGGEISGESGTPVVVAPNGIDLEEFDVVTDGERAAERRAFALAPERFVVGFVGDYQTPRKGLDTLIRALAGTGAELLVAGRGDERGARCLAEAIGTAIRFAGFVAGRRIMAAADVVAVPSRYEPFSLVALEAAARGVPLLVSARAGAAESLGDASVVIDDPVDVAAWRREITRIRALAPPERSLLGLRGRPVVEAMSWDRTSAQAADVVEETAARAEVVVGD